MSGLGLHNTEKKVYDDTIRISGGRNAVLHTGSVSAYATFVFEKGTIYSALAAIGPDGIE
jgi:hypothetical protein